MRLKLFIRKKAQILIVKRSKVFKWVVSNRPTEAYPSSPKAKTSLKIMNNNNNSHVQAKSQEKLNNHPHENPISKIKCKK